MSRTSLAAVASVFCAAVLTAGQPLADRPGFKDPALFARMPGYFLSVSSSFKESQFDAYEFNVRRNNRDIKERVEGHLAIYCYYFDTSTGKPRASGLQIARNYQNAATAIGGEVLYEAHPPYATTTVRVTKNGQEAWVEVRAVNEGMSYYVTIVERLAMKQDVTANADAWRNDIASSGRAVVYGILFDTDKATLKPESEGVLREIAALLAKDQSLNLLVVGHTDMTGELAHNMKLSEERASAVVAALVGGHGVAAGRLKGYGVGPLAPVASNDGEDGRAKNRRVELVKR